MPTPEATLEVLNLRFAVCPDCGIKRPFYDDGLGGVVSLTGNTAPEINQSDRSTKWASRLMTCQCGVEYSVPVIP